MATPILGWRLPRVALTKTAVSSGWRYWLNNFIYASSSPYPHPLFQAPSLIAMSGIPFWPALRDLDWLIARLYAKGARYYRAADPC
ncbi:MAG: hypothetical protein R3E31_11005 [Chloroflexota bacterium]